jgi:hypothetical protein
LTYDEARHLISVLQGYKAKLGKELTAKELDEEAHMFGDAFKEAGK